MHRGIDDADEAAVLDELLEVVDMGDADEEWWWWKGIWNERRSDRADASLRW